MQHDEGEFFVGCNHDFVHAGANFDECDFFVRVQRLDGHLCLVCELGDEGTVVDGILLVHGGLDSHTLLVDDDDT